MIYLVALAEAAALVLLVGAFASLMRSQQRAHARREDLLVNQLLHATGHTWQPAPADAPRVADDLERHRFTATPEQRPIT